MNNFDFHAPTNILFGKNQINQLPNVLKQYGKTVLLTYGGGSIKRSGLYDDIYRLIGTDTKIIELGGIEPNPRLSTVIKGVDLCKENNVDVILSVGGGSTIDCSKAIAAGVFYDGNPWDFVVNDGIKLTKALPIVTILTIAATGSEMNWGSVITNEETKEKLSFHTRLVTPKVSILDPTYTFSVPTYQTMAGSADIFSHLIENYFNQTPDTMVQDGIAEGLMRTVLHYTPTALTEPTNYEARANLMWASSLALNGLTGNGKNGVWSCHPMEHELSAYYDITHGIGLAILTPRWMEHVLNDDTVERFALYGHRVFDLELNEDLYITAKEAIKQTYDTFVKWGVPMTLPEVGIDDSLLNEMAEQSVKHSNISTKAYVPLSADDVLTIYTNSLVPMTF
ncbi:iron-containing alcohol dehydrogenase [Vagococcus luciliae]|uniref:NADH-dependent butanol dehydrogenase A n=1 Tax=Vagococcus luciliae TaxID=2920380 RepID=A0ABY5P1J5_9ENTE|nr:iron-containing alcohol dehydrogenase [Vagococcus luciliae]UUV99637.1 NADH-dependent butanol dehydrogenase A [Vagococcus luciliae]